MSVQKETRTEISEIGEFGLIERIKSKFNAKNKSTIVGIGDDTAVIDAGDYFELMTTDMLVEGVHFDLSYMPLRHLGYKSVAVNVSDIAAMNGQPKQITVSVGLSNRFSVEAIEALYEGIQYACKDFGVDLVGGDTSSSPSGLIISIAALGTVDKNKVVYRKNAKVNDIICVTGDLGAAYLGLQVLEREKAVFASNPNMQPEMEKYDEIVTRQLKPTARIDVIHELDKLELIPTAMIDVSDGLASELFHLASQSALGITIYEDRLPISNMTFETAVEFNIDPTTCALNGGEDYELLFTIGQTDFEKIKNHPNIVAIGYIDKQENGNKMVTKNHQTIALQAQGWNHFD